MKKVFLFVLAIFTLSIGFLIGKVSINNEIKETNLVLKNNNTLSMMLETDYNSNSYVASESNEWPTSGYIFNSELSRCEYGSKLSWDDSTNEVLMTGNSSDKCYVYFDKYKSVVINSLDVTTNSLSVTITINATAGSYPIANYYYSIDNGKTYIKNASNTYTFSNLSIGTYNIKCYVLDANGKRSETVSKEVSITSVTLASYVKSLYTGVQGENNLYYHDSTLENGAGDNSYRYAGAHDEVNNFVCFGSDEETCPDDNLYRIIGVFGDQVKLIKWDYANSDLLGTNGDYNSRDVFSNYSTYKGNKSTINTYYWNSGGTNTWSESKLNTINLNTNYINNIETTWSNKITTTNWIVGGNTYENTIKTTVSNTYKNEITSPAESITYSDKIGLMYVSDYGYSASPSAWTTDLILYDDSNIISSNWMYMGLYEWTIVPRTDRKYIAFSVYSSGIVGSNSTTNDIDYTRSIRPTFYLNSNVDMVDGCGSKSDPYRIS